MLLSCGVASGQTVQRECSDIHSVPVLASETLSVVTLNVSHGRKTAWNQLLVSKKRTYSNLDDIADLLRRVNPHVVALQEADASSRWSGKFDHVAYLSEKGDYPCFVHGRHSDRWISSYGTALLSQISLQDPRSLPFAPSWPSKQKGFVVATLDWANGPSQTRVTIASVHLDFLRAKVRDSQVYDMVSELSSIGGPLVLMGDLNSGWDDDTSHVRMLADELNLHAYYPEHAGLGTYKKPTGKRLDWVLISRDLEFREYRVLPDIVADHFAVYAEISHSGGQK